MIFIIKMHKKSLYKSIKNNQIEFLINNKICISVS